MTPITRTSTPIQLWLIHFYIGKTWVDGMHYLNRKKRLRCRHKGSRNSVPLPYLDEDDGTTAKRWLSWCFFVLKYAFYHWTRQRTHSWGTKRLQTRLPGDKTIPDTVEPRLESFYPPLVAGIDQPHRGEMDYNNHHCKGMDVPVVFVIHSHPRLSRLAGKYTTEPPVSLIYSTAVIQYMTATRVIYFQQQKRKMGCFMIFKSHTNQEMVSLGLSVIIASMI